ncbi:hypothetical protein NHP190012_14790 [Helicobacter sp. NHP19-012]|uniref:Uncharacterized protein n=1 Tax=Helicobacter gastrofelis TaxID=2849642 RepID=A0ABM7SIP7_9HELI|nr:hypothetical protein NHP190012_14790 [Helicobacter sp. NHP19-012]
MQTTILEKYIVWQEKAFVRAFIERAVWKYVCQVVLESQELEKSFNLNKDKIATLIPKLWGQMDFDR